MQAEILKIVGPGIVLVVVSIFMWSLKWVVAKGKLSVSNAQWDLIRKIVEDAVQSVEHQVIQKKKYEIKVTSEEKLKLAKEIIKSGLKEFKLEKYEVFVDPIIQATLQTYV